MAENMNEIEKQPAKKAPFFKTNAFKCVCVLLCVLLISGVFLTIMYGFLEVTDEERLSRAISKIYGKNVDTEQVQVEENEIDTADILEVHHVKDDGNYLVKSRGKGGFAGTVTCWVVVELKDNKITGIMKVTVDSYVGETQMAEIKDSFLAKFHTDYKDDTPFTTDAGFLVSGSTKSSNAICNAVNGAIDYIKSKVLGISIVNRFEGFAHIDFIDKNGSDFVVNADKSVTFTLKTTGNGEAGAFEIAVTVSKEEKITAYTITKNGSTNDYFAGLMPASIKEGTWFVGKQLSDITAIYGDDLAFKDHVDPNNELAPDAAATASKSTYECMKAAAFALKNYKTAYLADTDIFEGFDLLDSIEKKKSSYATNADNSVTYTLVTTGNGEAGAFEIEITVGADKKISAYAITKNGSSNNYFAGLMPASIKEGTWFVGKQLSDITAIYGDNLAFKDHVDPNNELAPDAAATASKSTYICMRAAAFALKNYEKCLGDNAEGGNA